MDLRGSWLTLMHMKFGSAFQSAPSGISQVTVNWNHLSSCSREYCYQAGKSRQGFRKLRGFSALFSISGHLAVSISI